MKRKGWYPAIRSIVLLGKSVLAAQRGCCWLCNEPMREERTQGKYPQHPQRATQDHILPKSVLKGQGIPNNKLWAHRACNNDRGNRPLTEGEAYKARMILIGAVAYQLSQENKHS